MKSSTFLRNSILVGAGFSILNNSMAKAMLNSLPLDSDKMPVLFVGHGNPMNAIEENQFTQGWREMVKGIKKPKAILCISAHWETNGTKVLSVENPKMIYDMYGFPPAMYKIDYPAKGAPGLANSIAEKLDKVSASNDWGFDHGTWSILVKMFPKADVPCFQLSLNKSRNMKEHYDLAAELDFLRARGVLIVGSGNIVHNLLLASLNDPKPHDWAKEFDAKVVESNAKGDHQALINYPSLGNAAELSVNSA
jgi:4,5-DOPA dioxygenase extradiol